METGTCKLEFKGHTDSIWGVHFDQNCVITASSDQSLKGIQRKHTSRKRTLKQFFLFLVPFQAKFIPHLAVWDINSGMCVSTLQGHKGTVFCMWAEKVCCQHTDLNFKKDGVVCDKLQNFYDN